ncbi:MAG: amidohydrolase family protein [Gemmatimonadales bacterium]
MRRSLLAMATACGCVPFVVGCGIAPRGQTSAGPVPARTSVIELTGGRWYDGRGFVARTMYIENGVFRSRPGRVDSTVDLAGGYVVPPFGDAHTHNLDGPFNLDRVRDAYLAEGTFYVAVLTNTASRTAPIRQRFNRPCDLEVRYANGGLTSTLSHPFLAYEPRAMNLTGDWLPHADAIRISRIREDDAYWFLDNREDLDRKWPAILAAGPDLLKIFLLDARESPPSAPASGLPTGHGLRPSLVPEIVRRAHQNGLPVAAHIETAADFRIAVAAGVNLIAHLPGYVLGTGPDGRSASGADPLPFTLTDADARMAGKRGVAITPTARWTFTGNGPDSAAAVTARHALMRENLNRLRAHGARVVIGSDWFGETAWGEVLALQKVSAWSNADLLAIWAVATPQQIFPSRKIGRLEPGFEASFLVLDEDPIDRLNALRRIRMRVKQGCTMP